MPRINISEIAGIKTFQREIFHSEIGYFSNLYNKNSISTTFLQDSISFSCNPGTVRGLHFQSRPFAQAKLINVLQGSIIDFFLDLRADSSTFLDHGQISLSASEPKSLFIPRGFAHGFITLESNTIVSYKLDNSYNPATENTILWNDPMIEIEWPKMNQYYHSPKDLCGKTLAEVIKEELHL